MYVRYGVEDSTAAAMGGAADGEKGMLWGRIAAVNNNIKVVVVLQWRQRGNFGLKL